MEKYGRKEWFLRLISAAGVFLCAANLSSGSVWAASGQAAEYNQGCVILKQKLKEEELEHLTQPEDVYTDESGVQYHLSDWEIRELPGAAQSRTLEKTEVYHDVEGAETLPPYMDSRQEEEGARISGRLYMQESRVLREEWKEDFLAPVTFYSYGAEEYELGTIKISGEDILGSALEEQSILLSEMGLSPEDYRITSMEWEGESFMDETGQICRTAEARGARRLRDYEAVYRGQVQVTEPVSYEVSAVYEPGNPDGSPREEAVQDETVSSKEGETQAADPFLYWIRTGVIVTAALGSVGVFLGIFLYFVGKNREKREEKELEYR